MELRQKMLWLAYRAGLGQGFAILRAMPQIQSVFRRLCTAIPAFILVGSTAGFCDQPPVASVHDGKIEIQVKALNDSKDGISTEVKFVSVPRKINCTLSGTWDGKRTLFVEYFSSSPDFNKECEQADASEWVSKVPRTDVKDFVIVDDRDKYVGNPVPAPEGAVYETVDQDKWYGPRTVYVGRKVAVTPDTSPIVNKRVLEKSVWTELKSLDAITADQASCPQSQSAEFASLAKVPKYASLLKQLSISRVTIEIKDFSEWNGHTAVPESAKTSPSASIDKDTIRLDATIETDGKCHVISSAQIKALLDGMLAQYKKLPPSLQAASTAKDAAAPVASAKAKISISVAAKDTRLCGDTSLETLETRKLPFAVRIHGLSAIAGEDEIALGPQCTVHLKKVAERAFLIDTDVTAL